MTFLGLLAHNVLRRRLRAAVTALAVAIGVTAVMTLGVLTYSLRQTAVSILRTGNADFTVSQRGVSDILDSSLDKQDIEALRRAPGVESAIGTFVATGKISAAHPFFIEVGIRKRDEAPYGITILIGRSFADTAHNEMMLGWRAAKDFGVDVGDSFKVEERTFRIVGIFSTKIAVGDTVGMCSRWSISGRGTACPACTRSRLHSCGRTRTSRLWVGRSSTQPAAGDGALGERLRQDRPQSRAHYGRERRRVHPGTLHRRDRCDEHVVVVVLRTHTRVRSPARGGLEPPADVRHGHR